MDLIVLYGLQYVPTLCCWKMVVSFSDKSDMSVVEGCLVSFWFSSSGLHWLSLIPVILVELLLCYSQHPCHITLDNSAF